MWNPYSHMKAKCKKNFDDTIHIINMMDVLLSMFDYENMPDTLPVWLVETMFVTEGACCVTKMDDGNLYTGTGGPCGDIKNFYPTEYQIVNTGVGDARRKIGVDCVVGFNNSTKTPDWLVNQYASILTEIDVSERCNVLFSRFLRIPKVQDSKEKAAIESAVKTILDGKFEAVISKNVLEQIADTGDSVSQFLDLVDVKEVDKLQYLNQYRDNITKRFYMHYGQGMQTTSKLAQQTSDEIHGTDAVSMIHVLDRLRHREKFVADINTMYGTNITVKLSEAWQDQREEMQELYSNGDTDDTPTGEDGDASGEENDIQDDN